MRILVLGGTRFLGRALVETSLARGHEVTLFNRGETNAELFPEAEKLRGDRTADLSALDGRSWDAVLDPSGYVPHVVRQSAEALRNSRPLRLHLDHLGLPGLRRGSSRRRPDRRARRRAGGRADLRLLELRRR